MGGDRQFDDARCVIALTATGCSLSTLVEGQARLLDPIGFAAVQRTRRDRDVEASRILDAIDTLISGSSQSARSARLTVAELIAESGLRRDVVYEHAPLLEYFRVQARAREDGPSVARELLDRHQALTKEYAALKAELDAERRANARLRTLLAEMVVELRANV